jgi:hypothetical protein
LSDRFRAIANGNGHTLLVACVLVLSACATPSRPLVATPEPQIPESRIGQIDSEIGAASFAASELAKTSARRSMERWLVRVYQRTDTDFIPWFTSYWTQKWLGIKMAWYTLDTDKGRDAAPKRLAKYLDEQYRDRVLYPARQEIDPYQVRGEATRIYLQVLGDQLREIPRRDHVPAAQVDRRLKDICAITLVPPPAHTATLYQLIHTDPIDKLAAYAELNDQIREAVRGAGSPPGGAILSPLALRVGDRLIADAAISGGAGAAAIVVGGVAGTIISVGATGYGVISYENERPHLVTQLQNDLNAVVAEMWIGFMETNVLDGVYYISEQIERCVTHAAASQ